MAYIQFTVSDIINNIWADPDNHRVANEAHALFRAHLMLLNIAFYDYNPPKGMDVLQHKNKVNNFLKMHLAGKPFNTIKNQINSGVSFIMPIRHNSFVKSQWWKDTCVLMEREGLLKTYAEIINTPAPEHKFNAL